MDIKIIEALERMRDLEKITSLALQDLNDQSTGWYYQLKSARDNAARALRNIDDE